MGSIYTFFALEYATYSIPDQIVKRRSLQQDADMIW